MRLLEQKWSGTRADAGVYGIDRYEKPCHSKERP
jgi:hypothetical protein